MNRKELQLIQWENNKISSLEPVECSKCLLKILTAVFELYGNRTATNETVMEYAVISIMENFSHLALDEISEAFKMWSKNEIEGSEPYGGEFNLLVINRILSDYDKHRKTQRKELFSKIHAEKSEIEKEIELKSKIQKFNENIKQIIQDILKKAQRYEDVQDWMFRRCEREGFISLTREEKFEIFQRAVEEEKQELRQELYFSKDKTRVKEIRQILESENGSERSKVIAGKIAIFENKEKILNL